MKIVIENTTFPFNEGCRLLKLKHAECPYPQIADVWNDIKPMTFAEIAQMPNIEQRRVGVLCMGLERLASEIQPILMDTQTLRKKTEWVKPDGSTTTVEYDDTYELFKVEGKHFMEGLKSWQRVEDCYFIKCKDTSTDRAYFIWVDPFEVYKTNNKSDRTFYYRSGDEGSKINAIQAIAWSIQTNVPEGNIEKILRQGDCILIKPTNADRMAKERHLTEHEYRTLLVAES